MKNLTQFLALVAKLTENFLTNPGRIYDRFEMFVNENWDELAKEVKIKFYKNTKFIDIGWNNIAPYSGPEKTNKELLDRLISKVREKGYKLGWNNDTTGYDDDIANWGFINEKITETSPNMDISILPDGAMSEGTMYEHAKIAKMQHEHLVCDILRMANALWDRGFYVQGLAYGCWTIFPLKNRRKSDNVPCKLYIGFNSDGEFLVDVRKVYATNKWHGPQVSLPLSQPLES